MILYCAQLDIHVSSDFSIGEARCNEIKYLRLAPSHARRTSASGSSQFGDFTNYRCPGPPRAPRFLTRYSTDGGDEIVNRGVATQYAKHTKFCERKSATVAFRGYDHKRRSRNIARKFG